MIDFGSIGAVIGAIGIAGFATLIVAREVRLARRRRDAIARMRRRRVERWPS